MSELDTLAPGGVVQLQNAPAGLDDATFDSLFPSEPRQLATPAVQQPHQPDGNTAPPVNQQTPPAPQTPAEPFIKATKSVYKTSEDAIKGIDEKDSLIDQLRQRYALTTGIDPITGKPVSQAVQPQQIDYTQSPDLYLKDLYEAANSGDPTKYAAVQEKLIADKMKPLQPLISQVVKEQALKAIAGENPEAGKFIESPAFQKTLEENPDLKAAIATAETDSRFHTRLPGLYKLAFRAGQGMQLPDLIAAAKVGQPPQNSQPQPVRTTVQPTTLSPGKPTAAPSLKTLDGIKATIQQMEQKGISLDF